MDTYKIKGVFNESLLKKPKLLSFIGKEVEIIIKKESIHHKNISNDNIMEVQEIMGKYIPKKINLSDELIEERRKAFESE
jgi:hypothetical protein